MRSFVRNPKNPMHHFVGRDAAVEAFRASVRFKRGLARPAADTSFYPHLFLASGEGGMGKTTLLRRWLTVAHHEGWPESHMVVVELDAEHPYRTIHDLATAIRTVIIRTHPRFGHHYQALRARYDVLYPRFKQLEALWTDIQALRASGKLEALIATYQGHLSHDAVNAARLDPTDTPYRLVSQMADRRVQLHVLSRFAENGRQPPQSLAELLQAELGDDAALFVDDQASVAAFARDLAALAQTHPLLLAVDTYEVADQHDDWLRAVFLAVGEDMLLVIAGRNAIHRRAAHQWAFRDDFQSLVWHVDLGEVLLTVPEVESYLRQSVSPTLSAALVHAVYAISRGIPLAVNALAAEITQTGDLSRYQGMEFERLDRRRIVQLITERFLRAAQDHLRDDPATADQKRWDRFRIRTLAILLRLDPALIAPLWGVEYEASRIMMRELRTRYSFVFAGLSHDTYVFHDLVREFIRHDLMASMATQFDGPPLRAALTRMLPALHDRLAAAMHATPEDCYTTPHWRHAVLDLLNALIWIGDDAAAQTLLINRWIEARYYDPFFADTLRSLVATCPTATPVWNRILGAVDAVTHSAADEDPGVDALGSLQAPYGKTVEYERFIPYEPLMEPSVRAIWYYFRSNPSPLRWPWIHTDEHNARNNRWIDLLEMAYTLDPTLPPLAEDLATALIARGRYAASQGDYPLAIVSFTRSLSVRPHDADTFTHRGVAKYDDGDVAGALADLNQSLAIDPHNAYALTNRGVAKYDLGDFRGALEDLSQSLTMDPENAYTWSSRGMVKARLGDFRGALADYDSALRIAPDAALTLAARGQAKAEVGDRDGALLDYAAALRICPDDAQIAAAYGLTKSMLGDRTGALAAFDDALRMNPEHPEILMLRGIVNGDSGNVDGALADFDRALTISPDHAPTLNARGYLRIRIGDFAGAHQDIQSVLDRTPHDLMALTSMAELLLAQNDQHTALEWIAQAMSIDPEATRALIHESTDYDGIRTDPRFIALVGAAVDTPSSGADGLV